MFIDLAEALSGQEKTEMTYYPLKPRKWGETVSGGVNVALFCKTAIPKNPRKRTRKANMYDFERKCASACITKRSVDDNDFAIFTEEQSIYMATIVSQAFEGQDLLKAADEMFGGVLKHLE